MEPKAAIQHDAPKSSLLAVATVLLGLGATFSVCSAIAEHWRTYGWVNKSLGIMLLISLLLIPILEIRSERGGKKVGLYESLQLSYVWLLLATMIFNR